MRGWPIARALAALLGLLLLGIPLRSLTTPADFAQQAGVLAPPRVILPKEKIVIALTFSQPPETFALRHLGEVVLTGPSGPEFDYQKEYETEYPKEGIELVLSAKWPERFRKVGVNIQITRADGRIEKQTLWGQHQIEKMLLFANPQPKPAQ